MNMFEGRLSKPFSTPGAGKPCDNAEKRLQALTRALVTYRKQVGAGSIFVDMDRDQVMTALDSIIKNNA